MIKFNAKLLAAVSLAQSTEETRYYLCGVYFDGNIAVATDGHFFTCAHDEKAEIDKPGIFPISKKALTALKGKDAETCVIDPDENLISLFDAHGTRIFVDMCEEIDGAFPDWPPVVPDNTGGPTDAAFSAQVTMRINETAKIVHGGGIFTQPYRLTGADESSPHFVYYGVQEIFSVAMPVRCESSVYPRWMYDLKHGQSKAA